MWIDYYHNTKRYKKSLGLDDTKANRKIAESEIIPEFIYKLKNGMFFDKQVEAKVPTVSEFASVSFEMRKPQRKILTHHDAVLAYEKYIKPIFGDRRLNEIKPSQVNLWQNSLLSDNKLSPHRIKRIRGIFGMIFQDALQDEIIDKNPVRLVSNLPKHNRKEPSPFSFEEINKILNKASGQFRNFYAFGFFTGMRTGELIGLKWEDIDFDKKEIFVKRTIGRGIEDTPKTQSSIRQIEILDILMPYIESQFELTGYKNSYVFMTSNDSHFFDIKNIRDHDWKRVLKAASVEYRTIYQMRHTFASMMIANGEDILWVSQMLGHTSPKMTLEKYAKYFKRKDKVRATFLEKEIQVF